MKKFYFVFLFVVLTAAFAFAFPALAAEDPAPQPPAPQKHQTELLVQNATYDKPVETEKKDLEALEKDLAQDLKDIPCETLIRKGTPLYECTLKEAAGILKNDPELQKISEAQSLVLYLSMMAVKSELPSRPELKEMSFQEAVKKLVGEMKPS